VNILLLWSAAARKGYRSPAWIGYHQTQERGGHILKGEKATTIVYGATFVPREEREKPEEEQARVPFLKRRQVFNIEQTAGLPSRFSQPAEPVPLPDAIACVETFLRMVGATILHGGESACYCPARDLIVLPDPGDFLSAPHYYATSLHEHAHWTGHPGRLNRDLRGRFGSTSYAAEELVAELACAYLCALLHIPGQLRHAEYLGEWVTLLKHDARAITTAAAKATEATDFLCAAAHWCAESEASEAQEEEEIETV